MSLFLMKCNGGEREGHDGVIQDVHSLYTAEVHPDRKKLHQHSLRCLREFYGTIPEARVPGTGQHSNKTKFWHLMQISISLDVNI